MAWAFTQEPVQVPHCMQARTFVHTEDRVSSAWEGGATVLKSFISALMNIHSL
jgi:hypothetical protein